MATRRAVFSKTLWNVAAKQRSFLNPKSALIKYNFHSFNKGGHQIVQSDQKLPLHLRTSFNSSFRSLSINKGLSASELEKLESVEGDKNGPDSNPQPSSSETQSLWWRATKFALGSTATLFTLGVGYVTYYYKTEELQQKITRFEDVNLRQTAKDLPSSAIEEIVTKAKRLAYGAFVDASQAYLDARSNIEDQIKGWSLPSSDKLLPDLLPQEQHVLTLVLDLNETLVHFDWKRERGWRTFKRPGVDMFLEQMAQYFEIVVFSDQLNMTVDPILERLDRKGYVRYRVYRDGTMYLDGEYVKDLTKLNRDPRRFLFLTGRPELCLQKTNLVPISAWKASESSDTELLDLIPFLEYLARHPPQDVRKVIASYEGKNIPDEFRQRSQELMKRQQERKQGSLFKSIRS